MWRVLEIQYVLHAFPQVELGSLFFSSAYLNMIFLDDGKPANVGNMFRLTQLLFSIFILLS